ncbi:MAG: hypothetical protein M0026_00315 [Nocardiopsaceae bacterium]|nr:hypothetical protein [Nocardiopsaceae bacterium]
MHRFLGLRPGTGFGLWAAAAGCEADVDTARDRFAETEAEAAFGADEAAAAQRR